MKTVFLLALALARRRSYLHALSVAAGRCVFSRVATRRQLAIMRSHISRWIVETVKLIESMTELLHMRSEPCQHHGRITVSWHYLTSCQRRFGGHLGSSRMRIYGTYLACIADGMSTLGPVVVDIFTLLHSLHNLYAATATTFLMKITWLLAGIFVYGME